MILVAVLPAILLLLQGLPIRGEQPVEPLKQLDKLVTTRIKEILEKDANTREEILEPYRSRLQEAADWPFAQLDEKIMAYNSYKSYEEATAIDSIVSLRKAATTVAPPVTQNAQEARVFRKKVIKVLRRLGIYDPIGKRVWKAIFSDEENLKKLKKKLGAIKDSNEDDSDDDYGLWDFVFSFWN